MKKNLLYAALISPALLYMITVGGAGSGPSAASQIAPDAKDDHAAHGGHEDEGQDMGADAHAETAPDAKDDHGAHGGHEDEGQDMGGDAHAETAPDAKDDHGAHGGHEDEGQDMGGDAHEDEGHAEGGDHVELSAEAADAAEIRTAVADTGAVSGQLKLPTEINVDADRVAKVSPQVEGFVAELYASEGDIVQAGATLARLTSRELTGLKTDYLGAVSAELLARTELERQENLWERQITTEAALQLARATFSAARVERVSAENRLHAVGISHDELEGLADAEDGALAEAYLIAPMNGKVIERSISLGEAVPAGGEPIFVIVDDSVVWADIAVYKEDLGKVEEGQAVVLQQEDGEVLAEGTISAVLPVIDEISRTATARLVVENSEHRMKPGEFVTALIATGDAQPVVRVPSGAIVSVEGKKSVFVPTGDGFEPRQVRTGAKAGGFTEIVSGLAAGDAFVSEGAFTLKAQLEKDAFGDGHGH